jgi:hypothetical protein
LILLMLASHQSAALMEVVPETEPRSEMRCAIERAPSHMYCVVDS